MTSGLHTHVHSHTYKHTQAHPHKAIQLLKGLDLNLTLLFSSYVDSKNLGIFVIYEKRGVTLELYKGRISVLAERDWGGL